MQTFVMPTTPTLMLVDVVPLPVPMRPSKNVPMPSTSIPTNNSNTLFISILSRGLQQQLLAKLHICKSPISKAQNCIMPYKW